LIALMWPYLVANINPVQPFSLDVDLYI
jgi:hypothetical protein